MVAAVAVVALQQRAVAPTLRAGAPLTTRIAAPAQSTVLAENGAQPTASREAISYTVPATSPAAPAAMPPARLTNYVFAHSRYSSGLAQRGVMADMLIEAEEQQPAANEAAHVPP